MRKWSVAVLSALMALVMVGCSVGAPKAPAETPAANPAPTTPPVSQPAAQPMDPKSINVAYVTSDSGLGDRSFNDQGHLGVKKATDELGIQHKVIEPRDQAEFEEQLRALARDGNFTLIIGMGSRMGAPMEKVALDYPNQKFAIIDAEVPQPNIASVVFKEHEGSFLAGALAALMTTQENVPGINPDVKVGFVGGKNMPVIRRFQGGFVQGVQHIHPLGEVLIGYTGTHTDPAKGKEYALAQFSQGADIIFQVATKTGEGVIAAAKETGKFAIGVDADQDYIAPGNVLTSMLKRADTAVYDLVVSLKDGTFKGGEPLIYGLKENGVSLTEFEYTKDIIPAEVLEKLEEIKKQILSGEIQVTDESGVFK